MSDRLTVVKGTLDVLVLKALGWGPQHGFEVAAWIEARSAGALALDDSGLYQALYRLEGKGLITAEWGVTEKNRRARYYRLTPVSSGGSALDVSGVSTADGANIHQWSWTGGNNQQWAIQAP